MMTAVARQPGLIAWSIGAIALVMVWTQPASSAADAADWGAIDAAVRDAVTAGDLPGGVVLVGRGDRILYRKAFGSRALVPAVEPATIDTVFDIASLTKVVATAPAVLALWEKGRIELDAPIGRYLSEFAGPRHREVTVRRVLIHSAGFPDLPPAQSAARGMAAALAAIARQELQSTPGSTFRYSDTGYIVLGELVRRVSGEGLDQFARRRFYTPLGMAHTTFRPPATWRAEIAPTELIGR